MDAGYRTRKPRIARRVALCLALGVAAVVVCVVVDLREAAASLPDQLSAALREGLLSDSAADIQPEFNAAPGYRHALILMDMRPYGESNRLLDALSKTAGGKATTEDLAEAALAIRKWGAAMRAADEASRRPSCWFDLTRTHSESPPELTGLKTLARLFAARAALRAAHHDLRGASADLAILVRIARHLGQVPLLAAAQAETACERLVMRAGAPSLGADSPAFAALIGRLPEPSLRSCVPGELALARARVADLASGNADVAASAETAALAQNPVARQAFEARVIETHRALWRGLEHNPSQAIERIRREVSGIEAPSRAAARALFGNWSQTAEVCRALREEKAALGLKSG
ncbi:MAG: hypothetical protein HYR64_10145 [Fimbriimonas ginsengisoli]|uniref:Uncharacterized protein n=1 Tax=Fimbriimonas ginsengisoli TaxID=1005039 RepID=A0A931PVB2_FIMGI|nr:hypothetical protein [Fimbriimonas ginsengisoli]